MFCSTMPPKTMKTRRATVRDSKGHLDTQSNSRFFALPPEIRLHIYEIALLRNIEVDYKGDKSVHEKGDSSARQQNNDSDSEKLEEEEEEKDNLPLTTYLW